MTDKIGRCKDCKWWNHIADTWAHERGWGACDALSSDVETVAPLAMSKNFDFDRREWEPDRWSNTIHTAPDFGCVQFEAKEQTDVDHD